MTVHTRDVQDYEASTLLVLGGLEDPRHARLDRVVAGMALAVLLGFGLWAAVTTMPEIAVATGQVTTEDPVAVVQHLEGGLIDVVLVAEGQTVREGQALVRFASATGQAELERLRARDAALGFQERHLRALRDNAPLVLEAVDATFAALAADQQVVHDETLRARGDRLSVLQQQLAQRQAERVGLAAQEEGMRQQAALHASELTLREALLAQGLTTRIAVLETRRALLVASAELERLAAVATGAARAAEEAEARLAEAHSAMREEQARELGRVVAERLEVAELIRQAWERVGRLTVLAPSEGIVKGLLVRRPGTVVPPGAPLLEIVPTTAALLVEARLHPRDIGFVRIGHTVRVKVQAFDYARFGTVDGTLVHLAATTAVDEQGQPYYAMRVALPEAYVGRDAAANRLLPGMTVQADVVTGGKTLLAYLLKPVHAAMSQSFRER